MKAHGRPNTFTLRHSALALALVLCAHAAVGVLASPGTDDAYLSAKSGQRDPFWPVGYVPENIKLVVDASSQMKQKEQSLEMNWNRAMKKIAISGISSKAGSEFYAVINGEIKSVGDTVSLSDGDMVYTWIIESISPPSNVKLRRVTAH